MNVDVVIPNEQIHITHLFSSVAFKKVKMHLINSYGKNDFVQDQNEMLNKNSEVYSMHDFEWISYEIGVEVHYLYCYQ